MKTYRARKVISSGRTRIDVTVDGMEVATFYPDRAEWAWNDFKIYIQKAGHVLLIE